MQVNGALLSTPGSSMPSGLPPPSHGEPDTGPASAAAAAQSPAPASTVPPSAASGLPAASVPHTAHGLSLLALLQGSGERSFHGLSTPHCSSSAPQYPTARVG